MVLSGGRISLKISTEVSELSNQGAFSLSTGTGGPDRWCVPALTVRRAETTVELPSGGAMMIAGLLQDNIQQDIARLPGLRTCRSWAPFPLARLPGRPDRAGGDRHPLPSQPASPEDMQTPADGLEIANDMDTILLGKLNKTFKHEPQATAGRTYQGPFGYVVE